MVNEVHRRIFAIYPFLIADGWKYKGFFCSNLGRVVFIHLRFEKLIRGKTGYAEMKISCESFTDSMFDLRGWIGGELHKAESDLIERRRREMNCAA